MQWSNCVDHRFSHETVTTAGDRLPAERSASPKWSELRCGVSKLWALAVNLRHFATDTAVTTLLLYKNRLIFITRSKYRKNKTVYYIVILRSVRVTIVALASNR